MFLKREVGDGGEGIRVKEGCVMIEIEVSNAGSLQKLKKIRK
jgi:hypothetical protein